ncbi:hypothetical protein [Nocardia sp. alder85J]|uniref:hypothetical protein n=1 Tax=Nocardia sp. alder85J TaxID=2862949 RepID=UPI001CD1B975|nr:hypothetical protein [Nocardia sp. alder85J]MCX4092554.1 hypothetical protein [Nocardia sp. alder85J]
MFALFLPDAVEALIGLDRLGEAEPPIDALERDGRRVDRARMLAAGLRCRAMLFAARGDLEAATAAAELAIAEHDRVPMPFERARTQLLVGRLRRRRRHRDAATAGLARGPAHRRSRSPMQRLPDFAPALASDIISDGGRYFVEFRVQRSGSRCSGGAVRARSIHSEKLSLVNFPK